VEVEIREVMHTMGAGSGEAAEEAHQTITTDLGSKTLSSTISKLNVIPAD
jgi:hypothetical protein